MKTSNHYLHKVLLLITVIILFSCTKKEVGDVKQVEPPKEIVIQSYSKNYGYSGDLITVIGENFPSKEQCSVFIEGNRIDVMNVAADGKTLSFKLPQSSISIPELKFDFGNRKFTNKVENNYSQNIGIINKVPGAWVGTSSPFTFDNDLDVFGIQTRHKGERIYFSVNKRTYSSLDNGISWNIWYNSYRLGDFHPTDNDEGWASQTSDLGKVPSGGSPSALNFFYKAGNTSLTTVFVENDMKNGILVAANRAVYKTTDGARFEEIVPKKSDRLDLQKPSFKLDIDHIWAIGYDQAKEIGIIYFCNGDNRFWNEYYFTNHPKSMVSNIFFVNDRIGYTSLYTWESSPQIKMFKTTNGGNTWAPIAVFSDMKWDISFVFTDENTGYVSSGDRIYITKDGGKTWTLEHTAKSPIKRLGYSENCVFAILNNSIDRKYLN